MKYYCNDCEKIIDADELLEDSDGFGSWYACPNCKSDKIEDCDKCEMCGTYIPPDAMFCEDCAEDIKISFENMVHGLSKQRRIKYEYVEEAICDWIEREVM